jgi:hypothetical protein
MVTMRYKATTDTAMLPCRKSLSDSMTALRAILRRVGRIHFDYLATGAFSLARQNRSELTPSGVTDALGEAVISDHPSHVQTFDGDYVELAHDVKRRLVVEVRALAGNLLMLLCQEFDRLAPAVASLIRTARYPTLRGLQFALRLAQKLRIFDNLTSREGGEILNPDINSNRIAGLWKESGLILLNGKDNVPPICFTFNRAGFNRSFDWTRKTNTTRADLGHVEFVAFQPKASFHLREGETIEACLAFKSRIPWCFAVLHAAKEGVKGLAQFTQGILEYLGVDFANVLSNFFDLWKLNGLSVVIDRKPIHRVGVTALLKTSVVQFAATIKPSLKNGFNSLRRLDFELVRPQSSAFYTSISRLARDYCAKSRNAKFISTQTSKTRSGWSTLSQKKIR